MSRCHQSDYQKLNFVCFEELRTYNTSETLWNHFKTILLDQEMNFKKNPVKKYFFILEKNNFEKKIEKNNIFFVSQKISNLENFDFFEKSKFSRKNMKFSISKKNTDFFLTFFENIFRPEKKVFFRWDFF